MRTPRPIFLWDEPKRLANLDARGLDFADAARLNWDDAVVVDGHPGRRGEPRYKATGFLDGRLVTVIFSATGNEAVSIISMRYASTKERKDHGETQGLHRR